jgi:hypothetical protein
MLRSLALGMMVALSLAASGPYSAARAESSIAGRYTYTGTDTDGSAYDGAGEVVVTKAPSGAYEIVYDGGAYTGVGQVTGDTFSFASMAEGKNSISIGTIRPDGSIVTRWWRYRDKGSKGTETWVRK